MTNNSNNVLYTGVTNNLERRICEHKNKIDPKSFSAKYNVNKLVYFEENNDIYAILEREKQIKSGSRIKKIKLIEEINPHWNDLGICINPGDCHGPEPVLSASDRRPRNDRK